MFSASKLKEYRLAKKLSQTDIANELGVTRATLSAWETGKTVPNKKHLKELAQVLHIETINLQEERKRPITRYLSNHSFLQYTVIKNKLEDFLCHNLSSH